MTPTHPTASQEEPGMPENKGRLRWNWAWTPFLVIGIALIPNAILYTQAKRLRVDMVMDNAHDASAQFDEDNKARQRFDDAGLRLEWSSAGPDTLALKLAGNSDQVEDLSIQAYRPNNRGLDQELAWPDAKTPLEVTMPVTGQWFISCSGTLAGEKIKHRIGLEWRRLARKEHQP